MPRARTTRVFALCALLAACGGADRPADEAPVGGAPASGTPEGVAAGGAISESELQRYRLNMNRLQSWHRVQLASANRPDLLLGEEDDDEDDLDEMNAGAASRLLARIEARPEIAGLIRQHGMEPREYVLTSFAFVNAIIGDALTRSGGEPIPEGTNRENVEFVRQHEAELRRMRDEQDAARRAAPPPEDG
jgi:hypothetical protein